jgi:DNA-binding transcriptional LysR family regulator
MFTPELTSGAVRAVLTEWTLPEVELWVVFPAGRMASAKARAFAAFVEDEFDQHPFRTGITGMVADRLSEIGLSV